MPYTQRFERILPIWFERRSLRVHLICLGLLIMFGIGAPFANEKYSDIISQNQHLRNIALHNTSSYLRLLEIENSLQNVTLSGDTESLLEAEQNLNDLNRPEFQFIDPVLSSEHSELIKKLNEKTKLVTAEIFEAHRSLVKKQETRTDGQVRLPLIRHSELREIYVSTQHTLQSEITRRRNETFASRQTMIRIFSVSAFLMTVLSMLSLISERKAHRARQALQLSIEKKNQYIQSLLKSLPDILLHIDTDNRIVESQFPQQLAFFAGNETLHLSLKDIFPESATQELLQELELVRGGGDGRNIIQTFECRDGEMVIIEFRICSMKDREILLMGRDITQESNSRRIIEEQKNMLSAAARMSAIGEMAGGIAHEINNPLMIIGLNSEAIESMLLAGDADPLTIFDKIEAIRNTTQRITKIVKSLRTLARQGPEEPMVEVSVSDVINQVLDLATDRLRKNRVEIFLDVYPKDLKVSCRPVQIAQVLLNLLNNACDAIQGLDSRWIRIEAGTMDGDHWLSVTDSGPTLSEEQRQNLFRAFYTTKNVGVGMGLGLTLCKGIVESHGGTIGLADWPNTRFVVRWPRIIKHNHAKAA